MKSGKLFIAILALAIAFVRCSAPKTVVVETKDPSIQKLQDANNAFSAGDYQKALTNYEEIVELKKLEKKRPDSTIYQNAGISAWELKQTDKAIQYLEIAKRYPIATDKTYSILAKIFLEKDNLSKEITNLEAYTTKYPQGSEIQAMRKQLFNAYLKSENWDSSYKLWTSIDPKDQNDAKMLNSYFKVCEKLNYKNQLDGVAQKLLKADANNIDALEHFAEKYYWLAENSYIKEMKAYNEHKTQEQYQKLLAAFKVLNENYKISRDYFLRLYQISPKSRYATFLGNIFTRFENKEKADYYYNLAKKK